MDNYFYCQVEQKRILEQIEIQIGQNLNLSEIIQSALDRSCSLLGLDRLLIYQIDIPLKSNHSNFETIPTNAITYESRKSKDVISVLYYQDEVCWQPSLCKNKYHQGSCLVVDDTEASHLDPCLKSAMAKLQVKSKVVTPINVRNKLWGLIIAHQCSEPRKWQHQDVQFIRQIAEYIVRAIYHHQSYQQLQEQKQLLEKQVKIQAQQIRNALIAAEAASKSKHDFLGSMSHELRTPLTCVIGLSSTLLQWSSAREGLSPEKQQEYLHLIQRSGKHLLGLINNILEFSDIESGKYLLNIQQVSLTELVKRSIELVREDAIAKEITLCHEVKIEPEQDYFMVDEARIRDCLLHILSNGIKFTPEGGKVTLRTWREKHRVVFQIEDTGIGIAPEEIPSLFEKFKQVEEVRQRIHGGAGLGLALSKKLVELHGGTINVESALGEGSVFTIYLPQTNPEQLGLTKSLANAYDPCSKMVVLITEDEKSATSIRQLLNTIEYQAIWLTNLAVAVKQIESIHPEIVIIDKDCSVVGIKNVVSAIANSNLANNTRVALLCDRFDSNEWRKFIEYGVDEYLLKSMNPIQTLDKINGLIQRNKLAQRIENK